ncbi:arylamine N-acetyltransferase family protein [Streptomyces jumonjinensis]|uniref:Arylamine N-acetyltransferase n=1 Tax=Streptomyces jumonjinensis TaxID=1945 RepID=A0A646KC35_STRJU|nr:arylamine N-acetyltransferase [Streptomyces jumonjinensis]MQS99868.1 arylamine N-acetyltransferase [Streptomyces jumonjinensis]
MDAYLRRIGADRPQRADATALRDLQTRHLRTVPFENLSVHLGEDIVLAERPLVAKIVESGRGGFCYELNGAFAALLRELGFAVALLQARVYDDKGRLGIPYDHLALLVETVDGEGRDGGPWLVDVGFGDSFHHPLAFGDRDDQADPAGTFRIVAAEHGDLDLHRDGKPQYRIVAGRNELADFRAGAWWHRTSPDSPFTGSLVCSRLTDDGGRITLAGRKAVTTTASGERREEPLVDDAAVLAAYRDHFGLRLDRLPPDPRRTED